MIKRDSLLTLEAYARERPQFRARVLEHKKRRTVHLGEHLTLQFEDELTIRYQVQEMLRIERIFEDQGIEGELDAYNPLIPDGSNWQATMLLEDPDENERRAALARLKGIEIVYGSNHPDVLVGGSGPNTLVGGPGGDKLFGLAGRDRLIGNGGKDRADGGPGRDICRAEKIVHCP